MLIKNVSSFNDFNNYLQNYKFIIVNISATWCKPCMSLKKILEDFINVIENKEFIYLKIEYHIYEEEIVLFQKYFDVKKIPYFTYIKNNEIIESFISSDFRFVSKKIFDYVKNRNNDTNFQLDHDF
jgi:thiol-disulfide isomerase/thioredoxin